MKLDFALWKERYGLNPHSLTQSAIDKIRVSSESERPLYVALLRFLYALGVAKAERLDAEAKATLIKLGDASAVAPNPLRLRDEAETLLAELGQDGNKPLNDWEIKGFRLASLLAQLPLDTSALELILDAATLLSRASNVPADCAYALLFHIYEQTKNPATKRAFASVEPDFWENYLAIVLKTMGRFLRDAAMEYIYYYELPLGSSDEAHLKRCEALCKVAVECCYLAHKASGMVESELDKKIYQFCSDAILNKDPKPLVIYAYRLLDLSSEDFFIALPKETLNKYIASAIEALND
ncbi:MAG: hypothetical protein NZM06_00910 [Chloroherpetonaceae bacterium]|nr:hypothetical protein [Chloroherpetonaceae bacterium]MDW8437159.1 hypothetical protein [Chloroherpetonaceae bacterium]